MDMSYRIPMKCLHCGMIVQERITKDANGETVWIHKIPRSDHLAFPNTELREREIRFHTSNQIGR